MAVMFVASGHGLIETIRPKKNAAIRGMLLVPMASMNGIMSINQDHQPVSLL